MLIYNDSARLGDGRNNFQNLRDEEAIACVREQNRQMLERYRWDDQQQMTDCEMRKGQMMHHSDLIRLVKRLNPAIFVEQSINYQGCLGFYHQDPNTGQQTYLTWMDKGFMPEFSYLLVDWQDIPEQEVIGWRTVLIKLMKGRALTWNQIKHEVDDPRSTVNARRWYAQTAEFRT